MAPIHFAKKKKRRSLTGRRPIKVSHRRQRLVYVVVCFLMNSIKEFRLKIDKARIQSRIIKLK